MEQQVARDHPDIWMALSTFRKVQEKEKAKISQPSTASLRRTGTIGLNDRQKQLFLRTLTRWVAEDLVPLSYLQKPAFRAIISLLDLRYKIPTIKTVTKDLHTYKEELTTKLHEVIGDCDGVIITADSWKSVRGESFFGVTLHYITDQFKLMTITLAMRPLTERQFAEPLKNVMNEVFMDLRLIGNIIIGTTDPGANMKRAMEDMEAIGIMWTSCAAHSTQLCIQAASAKSGAHSAAEGGLYPNVRVDRVIEKCHDLAAFIRRTLTVRKLVNKAQVDLHSQHENPAAPRSKQLLAMLDVPTRWNSQYFMVKRILQLLSAKREAEIQLSDGDAEMIKHGETLSNRMLLVEEERVAREYLAILEPTVRFTSQVSSKHTSTVSQVYPSVWTMTDHWERDRQGPDNLAVETETGKRFKRYLVKEARSRWDIHRMKDFHIIAMYLNPATRDLISFKRQVQSDGMKATLLEHGRRLVIQKIDEMLENGYGFPRHIKSRRLSSGEDEGSSSDEQGSIGSSSTQIKNAVRKELERYEKHKPSSRRLSKVTETDPLEWWASRDITYRFLPVLARQYLALQSVFSVTQEILS